MITAKTILHIPQYFEPRENSKRNYYRSMRILEPTIWWINYSELDLASVKHINLYDLDEEQLKRLLFEIGTEAIQAEYILKKIKYTARARRKLKLKVLDFKIYSERELQEMYYVSIATPDTKLTANSPLKIYCSCPDFRYTFAYVLYKHDALLYENEFPDEFKTIPPKKRNPYQIPFACKHVYTVLWHIYKHPAKYKFNEETFYRYNRRKTKNIRPKLQLIIYLERIQKELIRQYKRYTKLIKQIFKELMNDVKKRRK